MAICVLRIFKGLSWLLLVLEFSYKFKIKPVNFYIPPPKSTGIYTGILLNLKFEEKILKC